MITIGGYSGDEFDTTAQVVDDDTDYVQIATIQAAGRAVVLLGDVGAGGALAALKISASPVLAGTHVDLLEDADFSTEVAAMPWCLPATPHTTAAGGAFALKLDAGAGEYTIWAKKATTDTTLRIRGRILR